MVPNSGTVISVHGHKLVAFGHPMMQSGVTALPACTGKVLWFLASDMRSFKIGEPEKPLGALVNDRLAAIVVDENVKAPVIPVTMHIKGWKPSAPAARLLRSAGRGGRDLRRGVHARRR